MNEARGPRGRRRAATSPRTEALESGLRRESDHGDTLNRSLPRGLACSIIILIHAFKASAGQGFLCLCIPFYILYYAFARFEHEKKNLIIGVWLGTAILAGILAGMGGFASAY